MKPSSLVLASVAALHVASTTASAQIAPPDDALRALTEAKSLKCEFPWVASVDWDKDQPTTTTGVQEFGFHIDGLDRRGGKARLIGDAGSEDLLMVVGDESVSFIERVPLGTINVTAVYAWRDKRGRFKAVHSMHTAIGGPSPSQNYGYCQSW